MAQDKSTMRFLSFSNDKEDAEKEAKLREAAAKIEQAIAREKALGELVDYNQPLDGDASFDPNNDTRSLFERLMEQKNKKKEALEESQKLSNLVTKLDEDDADYLNEVAKNKKEEEIKKRLEIYDALEEKRRLDEKKIDIDEQKMKQSLIRGGLGSSRPNSSLKTKLFSMIKIKPKNKSDQKRIDNQEASDAITAGQGSSTDQANKVIKPSSEKSCQKSNQSSDRLTNNEKLIENSKSDDDEKKERNNTNAQKFVDGSCEVKNIMKCIGILPSLPQVKRKFKDSSDESSDDSIDQMDSLMPRVVRRRKK